MKEKALSADEVMRILEETRKRDYSYDRFFSTMCTQPHPIAVRAHDMFLETNLGDPGLFPGVADLEQRVVQMLGEMLGCPNAAGYVSTGGTESNIQAIRAARNEAGKKNGNIVVPESAHFSFDKIGDLLCLDVRKAELNESLKVDIGSVESQVDDNTVALGRNCRNPRRFGQVDPIEDLAKIAVDRGIHLHVDAAFGGFVLPFLEGRLEVGLSCAGRLFHHHRSPQDGHEHHSRRRPALPRPGLPERPGNRDTLSHQGQASFFNGNEERRCGCGDLCRDDAPRPGGFQGDCPALHGSHTSSCFQRTANRR